MKYDTQSAPKAEEWLSCSEDDRLSAIVDHHERISEDQSNLQMHAAIHAIVENQIAMGEDAPVVAMERLLSERLDRHDAVHAIGSVLSKQIFDVLKGHQSGGYDVGQYDRELAKLTAKKWRKMTR